jgi:hypothetical protein
MRVLAVLGALGAVGTIVLLVAVFGLYRKVDSIASEQVKSRWFFAEWAKEGQAESSSTDATASATSVPKDKDEKDIYALALAAMRRRWAKGGPDSGAQPPAGSPGNANAPSGPPVTNVHRTIDTGQIVSDWKALQEAARETGGCNTLPRNGVFGPGPGNYEPLPLLNSTK